MDNTESISAKRDRIAYQENKGNHIEGSKVLNLEECIGLILSLSPLQDEQKCSFCNGEDRQCPEYLPIRNYPI
jgi:hypothetical protein